MALHAAEFIMSLSKPGPERNEVESKGAQDVILSSRVFASSLILIAHFGYILSGVPRFLGDAVEGCSKTGGTHGTTGHPVHRPVG